MTKKQIIKRLGLWNGLSLRKEVLLVSLPIVLIFSTYLGANRYSLEVEGTKIFLYGIEAFVLDIKLALRQPVKTSGKIGVLAIDAPSIEKLGGWPLSRHHYAKALKNLKKLGVKWISSDVVFSEGENIGVDRVFKNLGPIVPPRYCNHNLNIDCFNSFRLKDDESIKDVGGYENLILGYRLVKSNRSQRMNANKNYQGLVGLSNARLEVEIPPDKSLADYHGLKSTEAYTDGVPEVLLPASSFGFYTDYKHLNNSTEWVPLLARINGFLYPSLSLRTVASYFGSNPYVVFDDLGVKHLFLVSAEDNESVIEIPLDPMGTGRMLVNPTGQQNSFYHFSFAKAYDDSFSEQETFLLKGMNLLMVKIPLNPIDQGKSGLSLKRRVTEIENILTQNFMGRSKDTFLSEIYVNILIGILLCVVVTFYNLAISIIFSLCLIITLFIFDYFFFFKQGFWFYLGIPSLQIVMILLSASFYKYLRFEKSRGRLRRLFRGRLSVEVVDKAFDMGFDFSGVENKEMTAISVNIQNFSLPASKGGASLITQVVEDSFMSIKDLVIQSAGLVDSHMDDQIQAFWGKPFVEGSMVDSAAKTSLEALFSFDHFQELLSSQGLVGFKLGIGINTGIMKAGTVGSDNISSYNVVGKEVAKASLLRDLNFEYGTEIILAASSLYRLDLGEFFLRDIDDISVHGSKDSMKIFELLRPNFLSQEVLIAQFVDSFNKGRLAFINQDFKLANSLFYTCLSLKPDDRPTKIYMSRVQMYIDNPPL